MGSVRGSQHEVVDKEITLQAGACRIFEYPPHPHPHPLFTDFITRSIITASDIAAPPPTRGERRSTRTSFPSDCSLPALDRRNARGADEKMQLHRAETRQVLWAGAAI